MKARGILNRDLAACMAALGHLDRLVIGDAGLPVPRGVPCIDLALRLGVPRFFDVLDAVLDEAVFEAAHVATETAADLAAGIEARAGPLTRMPHAAFKTANADAVAVVRTGEATPFCNVALIAGVAFG